MKKNTTKLVGRTSSHIPINQTLICEHRFSVSVLRNLARSRGLQKKYFSKLNGFYSYEKFPRVLEFALPGGHQKKVITCWNTKASKEHRIDTSLLFDSDQESQSDDGSSEPETDAGSSKDHVLSTEDEFLLFMMKLRLGLTNLDLAMRFNVAEVTVSNSFISWLNVLFIQLGTLKIWPNRNVILENMAIKFKEDYSNNIIIIDCTELKIQYPYSLVIQSQSYSNYTLKSLVGVDSMRGFMFISQLYTGSICDKQIVSRSGFLNLLSRKKEVSEILEGESNNG